MHVPDKETDGSSWTAERLLILINRVRAFEERCDNATYFSLLPFLCLFLDTLVLRPLLYPIFHTCLSCFLLPFGSNLFSTSVLLFFPPFWVLILLYCIVSSYY